MKIADLHRMQHVSRWHIVPMIREQTVASHSAMVAILAFSFAKILGHELTVNDIMYALTHDAGEIVVGDRPPTPKSLTGYGSDSHKAAEVRVRAALGVTSSPSNEISACIIKLADLVDAARWSTENAYTPHGKRVAQVLRRKVSEFPLSVLIDEFGSTVVTTLVDEVSVYKLGGEDRVTLESYP